ncbi:hypothetical protein A374_01194 [Fictibacillus macauensis ZFHKF-1]|uniref:Uncharacterized protein n=1 Tax=Fictibacillus macauensis ZFHKF-1 TaxID=1196324 RepID=I8J624_9BACL|nr:hypothetical protein [Fictibacillus macauensis]EIT87256.1 hypothetical protein A374_01194 [Fictibacillus macauensis ZFHKF-1]
MFKHITKQLLLAFLILSAFPFEILRSFSLLAYIGIIVLRFLIYTGFCHLYWSKKKLKALYWYRLRIFLCGTIIVPLYLKGVAALFYLKDQKHTSSSTLYVDTSIQDAFLSSVFDYSFLLLLVCFCYFTIQGIKKKGMHYFIGTLTLLSLTTFSVTYLYTINDYRAITKNGLVRSNNEGIKKTNWNEMSMITLKGKLIEETFYRQTSQTFHWSFTFYPKNKKDSPTQYTFSYDPTSIQRSLTIKKYAEKYGDLWIQPPTTHELSTLELPMKNLGSEQEFHELFK